MKEAKKKEWKKKKKEILGCYVVYSEKLRICMMIYRISDTGNIILLEGFFDKFQTHISYFIAKRVVSYIFIKVWIIFIWCLQHVNLRYPLYETLSMYGKQGQRISNWSY